MLRITQQNSSAAAKQYFSSADYLSSESVGRWGGEAARTLGLEGDVDKQRFDRLCDNLDPGDGKPLTARTRTDRTVGYDFTFSLPKSVSLLYALHGDEKIHEAFRAAVGETMQEIESEMKVRVRKGGKDSERVSGNMAWAEFYHSTSRPINGIADPHSHAHVFVFNASLDPVEREFKAGYFRDLKRDAPYFQAAFRVRLADKLQDLGYALERKRDDFEIAGMARLVARYSRRTAQIEKVAAELGITDPDKKAELAATTREKKVYALTKEDLHQEWAERLSNTERQEVEAIHQRKTPLQRPERGEKMAVDHAIEHCYAREAVVADRKLLTEALKRGVGSVTLAGVKRELAERSLIRGDYAGRQMVTTPDMLAMERKIVDFARQGRGKFRPLGDLDRPIARQWLNAGQKAAVKHVLGSRDRIVLVRGVFGSGKTTLEQEIGEALAENGTPVVALAPSAEASRGVLRRDAKFAHADTVARFLVDPAMQKQAQGGALLIDEASLLSSRDMLAVFQKAESLDARVILVGDAKRQHRSVEAGQPLLLLEESGLPVAEVNEILRQSGDYLHVTKALGEGKVAEAVAELDKLGWVREIDDDHRYQALAEAYLKVTAEKKRGGESKSALIVAPTHAEIARATHAVREALKRQGTLQGERTVDIWVPAQLTAAQKADATNLDAGDLLKFHQNAPGNPIGSRLVVGEGQALPTRYPRRFEVYRPAKVNLAVGDRIRVTAGGRTKDGKHRLETGMLLTIQEFTKGGDVVVDHGWVIAKDWGHINQGYAVTSHASQGKTVDHVILAQSSQSMGAANQRQFNVSISRGRYGCAIYTDDKEQLLKAATKPDQPLSATALSESVRRRTPLRKRLQKHLAFVRRCISFAHTHQPQQRIVPKEMTPHRESAHER